MTPANNDTSEVYLHGKQVDLSQLITRIFLLFWEREKKTILRFKMD